MNLECEYAISMVGRTSKRKKRACAENHSTDTRSAPTVQMAAHDPSQEIATNSQLPSPQTSYPSWSDHCSPDSMNFLLQPGTIEDSFPNAHHDHISSPNNCNGVTVSCNIPGGSDLLSLELGDDNFSISDFCNQSSSSACLLPNPNKSTPMNSPGGYAVHQARSHPSHGAEMDNPNHSDLYPHVSTLARIIEHLETHVQLRKSTIDVIMGINKTSMGDIGDIMKLEAYQRCKSCAILVATAMELIVTLYETAVADECTKPKTGTVPAPAPSQMTLPNIQFGAFHLDPEDQLSLRNQIICRELQRVIRIVQGLNVQHYSPVENKPPSNTVHKQWYVEMEHRTKTLVNSLGGSWH